MIAGERIIIGSANNQPIRYFRQALFVSILFHGLVAVFLVHREDSSNTIKVIPDQIVRVYLQQSDLPSSQLEPKPKNSAGASDSKAKNVMLKSTKQAAPKLLKKTNDSPPPITEVIPQPENRPLPNIADTVAVERFSGSYFLNCSPKEKQSEIRNCGEDDMRTANKSAPRRYEGTIANLFTPSAETVTTKFKRDMAKAEKLVSEIQYLDEMLKSSAADSEFLLQQQRLLSEEVLRIDQRYEDVNLLDILSSGIKVLNKALKESKAN